jgi:hypothetical protein
MRYPPTHSARYPAGLTTQDPRDREKQVKKALDVLQPSRLKRAAAKKEIEDGLYLIDLGVAEGRDMAYSNQSRKVLKKLITMLENCEKLAGNTLSKQYSDWAKKPLNLSEQIKRCQEALKFRMPPKRTAFREKFAVDLAYILLYRYRPDDEKAAARTRGGIFYRLSAILAGDDQKDLFNHMRRAELLDEDQTGSNFLPSDFDE